MTHRGSKRKRQYDDDLLVRLLAEGQLNYTKIAEQIGVSLMTVSTIARGVTRRDLYDRICTLTEDCNRRARRLANNCLWSLVARHIKEGLEGTGEPARRSREFVMKMMLNSPDPAGRYVGRAAGRERPVSRADLDLLAAVHAQPGAPSFKDLPKRTRRRLEALVRQNVGTSILGTDTEIEDDPASDGGRASISVSVPKIDVPNLEGEAEMLSKNAAELAEVGQTDQAIAEYTKAIETRSDHEPYHSARARLYDLAGSHDAALADWDKAVELDPDNVAVWRSRAHSHYAHKEYKKATGDFNKAVGHEPDSPYNYFDRGRAFIGRGLLDLAADDFTRGLDRMCGFPGYEHAAVWLHVARGRQGQDGSKELAEFRHTRVSTRGTWLIPVIRMYVGEMTPDECLAASADEDKQIHEHQMCNAHVHVGQHYLIAGDRQKAKEHFTEAVSMGPLRAAERSRYAGEQAAGQCPDPVESARLARCGGFSEYYAAVAELDIMARAYKLRQKRIGWGWPKERIDEAEAAGR